MDRLRKGLNVDRSCAKSTARDRYLNKVGSPCEIVITLKLKLAKDSQTHTLIARQERQHKQYRPEIPFLERG